MKNIEFKYTWCDYLTTCKHFPDSEVGSYECSCCKFHNKMTLDDKPEYDVCDTKKYFDVYTGTVECNF